MSEKKYTTIASAVTIEQAVSNGLAELELREHEVNIEVITLPSSGFLGLFAKKAKVKLTSLDYIMEEEKRQAQAQKEESRQKKMAQDKERQAARDKKIQAEREAKAQALVKSQSKQAKAKQEAKGEEGKQVEPKRESRKAKDDTREVKKEKRDQESKREVTNNSSRPRREENPEDVKIALAEGQKFLQQVFAAMDLDIKLEVEEKEGQNFIVLVGDNLGVLIGKRGQTLDSLQYLLNIAVNNHTQDHVRLMLDAENYRDRRQKTLEELADRLANKAKKHRKEVSLEPMSAYERKIIHAHLQNHTGIITKSYGSEPYRRLVISPKARNRK